MIRQSLGRATLHQIATDQDDAKVGLAECMNQTLTLLLPKPRELKSILRHIVENAVTLANTMTQELALFRCYMIEAGDCPLEGTAHIADSAQSGRVFMCTFPGINKVVEDKGKEILINVIKASVVLESAFQETKPEVSVDKLN